MQMQCKAVLYLSTRIVWDVNLVRKLHYIRGPRYQGSSNRGHNARASRHGRADKIQTARASGAANCCRVDGIREDGWARGLVPSVSLVSSRLARARVYSNPKIFRSGDIFWTYATDNQSRSYMRSGNLYRQPFEFSKRPTGRGILNNLPRDSSYKGRKIRTDFRIAEGEWKKINSYRRYI